MVYDVHEVSVYFTGCFAKTLIDRVGVKNLKSWASVNRGAIILSRYVEGVPFLLRLRIQMPVGAKHGSFTFISRLECLFSVAQHSSQSPLVLICQILEGKCHFFHRPSFGYQGS